MDLTAVLERAIEKEADASRLYTGLATRSDDPEVKLLLTDLGEQEREHRRELEALDAGRLATFRPPARLDLQLAGYLERTSLDEDSDLGEALTYAIHREHDAWQLYMRLAESVRDRETRGLLQRLAVMENTHKAELEELFDQLFLSGSG